MGTELTTAHCIPSDERWKRASHIAGRFSFVLVGVVQSLGRLDIRLRQETEVLVGRIPDEIGNLELNLQLEDHKASAYLWVASGGEVIRSVSNKLTWSRQPHPTEFDSACLLLERVRSTSTDATEIANTDEVSFPPAPFPVFDRCEGIGWQVSATELVSRAQLSDRILSGLESLC